MKTITLRNIPSDLAAVVERLAAEEGSSLNRTAIRLLEKGAGIRRLGGGEVLNHDLDHLAGTWSKEEAESFDRALADQRAIDPELWE